MEFLLLQLLPVSMISDNKYLFLKNVFQITFRSAVTFSRQVGFVCLFIGRITKPIHDWLLLVLMQKLSFDNLFMTKCSFPRHSCRIKYLSTFC